MKWSKLALSVENKQKIQLPRSEGKISRTYFFAFCSYKHIQIAKCYHKIGKKANNNCTPVMIFCVSHLINKYTWRTHSTYIILV